MSNKDNLLDELLSMNHDALVARLNRPASPDAAECLDALLLRTSQAITGFDEKEDPSP